MRKKLGESEFDYYSPVYAKMACQHSWSLVSDCSPKLRITMKLTCSVRKQ